MLKTIQKGVVALAVLVAVAAGASAVSGAASSNSSSSGSSGSTGSQGSTTTQAPQGRPADPAKVSHGPGETLLTGETADKVKQAALDKVSGATVIRVETDDEGSPYEAHLQKSDGTEVTVKVDKDFNVTSVEDGFGGGHP
jgi:hypothetical protein